jgi:hypothetical protein
MKRLIIGAIAAITVGLVAPAPSGASPITHSEYVTTIQQWGWIIDSDSAIRTGHSICASLDRGAQIADIKSWLHHEFVNTNTQPGDGGYYAAQFIQLAAQQFCPWTKPMDWNI